MKYLVRARMKKGAGGQLRRVILNGAVPGAPGYFADHLAECFTQAQRQDDGSMLWIETCYCERCDCDLPLRRRLSGPPLRDLLSSGISSSTISAQTFGAIGRPPAQRPPRKWFAGGPLRRS